MSKEVGPSETQLQELNEAFRLFKTELETKHSKDHDKLERLHSFFDAYEEKVNQPLTRAIEQQKVDAQEIKALREKIEEKAASADEAKERLDQLEQELALRRAANSPENKNAYKQSEEYKAAQLWAQYGDNHPKVQEVKATLRTDQADQGGILVPEELFNSVINKSVELDGIRAISRQIQTNGKAMTLPIRNTIPVAAFEGEAEAGGDSTSTYSNTTVVPFRQTFTVPVTKDMLMDSAFDMESLIMTDANLAFAYGEGYNFVTGTGFKMPQGFVADATLQADARASGSATLLLPNSVILVTGDIPTGYDPTYVFNRRTLATMRTFRADAVSASDGAGSFLWQPGLNGPVANTLNGYRYILANSMPDIAGGAFPVAFGDFSMGYTVVDRRALEIVRDDYTQKKNAIVEFTLHRWLTGQITLREPLKLIEIST